MTEGDALVIFTFNDNFYDGGATVYNVQVNTYQINKTFVVSRGGTWNTAGINQTDPRVLAQGNPRFIDSKSIGSAHIAGNSTATSIATVNTWTDFNFGSGLIGSSNIERWKIISPTGDLEYVGNEPFSGTLMANLTAAGTLGGVDYEFRAIKNGSPTPDDIISGITTTTALRNANLLVPVTAIKGDLFRLQVQNIVNDDDITIINLSINIQ